MNKAEIHQDSDQSQTVIRHKRRPFAMVDSEILRDPTISARAMGVYARLCDLPDNYKIRLSKLHEMFREGREAIETAKKELIERGYLHKQPIVNQDGTYGGWEITIHQTPVTIESKPNPQKPVKRRTRQGNSKKDISKNPPNPPTPPAGGRMTKVEAVASEYPCKWNSSRYAREKGEAQIALAIAEHGFHVVMNGTENFKKAYGQMDRKSKNYCKTPKRFYELGTYLDYVNEDELRLMKEQRTKELKPEHRQMRKEYLERLSKAEGEAEAEAVMMEYIDIIQFKTEATQAWKTAEDKWAVAQYKKGRE